MRIFIIAIALSTSFIVAHAKQAAGGTSSTHTVKGHFKKDGGYIAPHRATNPNNTQRDNWSSKPNVNPYTGKPGEKDPRY